MDCSKETDSAQHFVYVWVTFSLLFLSYQEIMIKHHNWKFCPCLQDVSKTAVLIKALFVCLVCSQNRTL